MVSLVHIFFRRIIKDLKQKELIPLKFIFFIHASTILVLYPYLTIHMRELGINVKETAIMSAVIPIIAIVMPPLAGMLADKIGNFRMLLAFFSTLGGPIALLLLLVPVGRLTITFPENIILDLSCNNNGTLLLSTDERNYSCTPAHSYSYYINMKTEACGLACPIPDNVDEYNITKVNEIELITNEQSQSVYYFFNRNSYEETPMDQLRNNRKLKNNELYYDSIRSISNRTVFFPLNSNSFNCDFNKLINNNTLCSLSDNRANELQHFLANIVPANERTFSEVENHFQIFPVHSITVGKNQIKQFPICDNNDSLNTIVSVVNRNNSRTVLTDCKPRCLTTTKRKYLCKNLKMEKETNIQFTFWSYLSTRVLIGIVSGTAFAMFEGAVIAILREHKADYGLQRVYASIGGMISSPLSGLLIDWASEGKDYTDFRPAFWLYAFLKITTGFLLLLVRLDFKKPADNVVGDMKVVLRKPEMIALLLSCFILGTAWGYIESFLFWLIQDLGGSRSLMGVTITVGGIFGIPLLVMSGPIIDKIGHANVLFIGFIFYAIRLMGYSLIYNAWYCLIFEAMESVTTGLAFTAAVTYAAKLSTTTTDTSIQGLLGGLYFGVGKGAGSLIGGFMIAAIGARETYQVFSAVTAITGIVYFLFNHFYLRKHATEGNEICKKEPHLKKTIDVNKCTANNNGKKAKKCDNLGQDNKIKQNGIEMNEKNVYNLRNSNRLNGELPNDENKFVQINLGFEKNEDETNLNSDKLNNKGVNEAFENDENKN